MIFSAIQRESKSEVIYGKKAAVATMNVAAIDLANGRLSANISGHFTAPNDAVLQVDQFQLDLQWE